MNLGDIIKPTGPLRLASQMFGDSNSPEQQAVMDDWDQGKFQRSDGPIMRGVLNQSLDNTVTGGIPVSKSIAGLWENVLAPNSHGDSMYTT